MPGAPKHWSVVEAFAIERRVLLRCMSPQLTLTDMTMAAQLAVCVHALDLLDTQLLGPPRQEFIELSLSAPDDLVLQYLYQPVG